ncbi:MAG: CvpA family protein [Clostridia bacterium]|nr:CvpA family protein [Clostridia bacterium]
MNYIIDIAILVIFAVCIITGVIKGFVKSLMDLITNIAAVIIARILSVQLAPQMFERFFENSIATRLESEIATLGSSATEQVQSALDSIPESMNGFLSLLGMDVQALTDSLSQQISASGGNVLDALMVNVVAPVMTVILKIILFVAIFVLCVFIFKLFTVIFEKFAKLPVIKQANGIFGGVFGAVKGIVVAAVLCFAVTILAGFIDNGTFLTAVENSKIVSLFNMLIKDMSIVNL